MEILIRKHILGMQATFSNFSFITIATMPDYPNGKEPVLKTGDG